MVEGGRRCIQGGLREVHTGRVEGGAGVCMEVHTKRVEGGAYKEG